jgi:Fe2+ or Zn2+ uptake regulation protein
MMSRNTVYYSLSALREAGLIQEVNGGRGVVRFDANVRPHHHLVCLECRRILDLMDDGLDHLSISDGQMKGFRVVGHRVEFQGYCAACQETMSPNHRPSGR